MGGQGGSNGLRDDLCAGDPKFPGNFLELVVKGFREIEPEGSMSLRGK